MLEMESPFEFIQSKTMAVADPQDAGNLSHVEKVISPVPRPGHALVKVHRAGVAFGDIIRSTNSIMRLKEFPWTPGYDVAGEIVAVTPPETADGIKGSLYAFLQPGTRVAGFSEQGGYSQFVELPLELLVPIPDTLSYDSACSLVLNYLTAWQMMFRVAKLPRLQLDGRNPPTILVQSAAGGVGTAVLQLAAAFNMKAYGTASAGKHDLVRNLGAYPIDYQNDDIVSVIKEREPDGLDAVFEARGFDSAANSRQTLKKDGNVVLFGFLEHYSNNDIFHRLKFVAKGMNFLLPMQKGKASMYLINPRKNIVHYREDLERLLHLGADSIISPVISRVLPLEDAGEAWKMLKEGKIRGKILLDPISQSNS